MIDDADLLHKRIAYIDTLRALYRKERLAGFVLVLLGAAILIGSAYVRALPQAAIWGGYALLAAGWVIMVYVMWRRAQWRRANPFNPNS